MHKKHHWQLRVANWIGASRYGMKVVGARRNARGEWQPASVVPWSLVERLGIDDSNNLAGIVDAAQLDGVRCVERVARERGGGGLVFRVNVRWRDPD